jgi:hypothetical protein
MSFPSLLLAALVTASTAPSATPIRPASSIVAIPPSWHVGRWTSSKPTDFYKVVGVWTTGDETIVLSVAPSLSMDLQQITARSIQRMSRDQPSMALRESGTVRLCRGQSGWKEVYGDSAGRGVTYVTAVTRSHMYFVTFAYSAAKGASVEGEAAAESLCPPPDRVVHLPPPPIDAPPWPSQDPDAYFPPVPGYAYWVWDLHPGNSGSQRVYVVTFPMLPGHGGLSYGLTAMLGRISNGRATVLQRSPITICQSIDGVYVSAIAPGTRHTLAVEAVMTVEKRRAYVAMYLRTASEKPRPEAEHAIRSLCP